MPEPRTAAPFYDLTASDLFFNFFVRCRNEQVTGRESLRGLEPSYTFRSRSGSSLYSSPCAFLLPRWAADLRVWV